MEIPICLAIFIDYLSHNYLTEPIIKKEMLLLLQHLLILIFCVLSNRLSSI